MRSGLLLRGLLGAAIAGLAFAALAQPAGALEISKHAKDSAETNAVQLKGRIDDGDCSVAADPATRDPSAIA